MEVNNMTRFITYLIIMVAIAIAVACIECIIED